MSIDKHRYPPDWPAISKRIRQRAQDHCERCGKDMSVLHPYTGKKVALQVAHLGTALPDGTPGDKHNKMDCRDENLAAMCPGCHLNYDRADHVAVRTRNEKFRGLAANRRIRECQAGLYLELNKPGSTGLPASEWHERLLSAEACLQRKKRVKKGQLALFDGL